MDCRVSPDAADIETQHKPPVGLLTKTLVRSPVVRGLFALHCDDAAKPVLVAVSNDHVRVLDITAAGRLDTLLAKAEFQASVLATAVAPKLQPPHHIKSERAPDDDDPARSSTEVVLVLNSDECLILSFRTASSRLHIHIECRSIVLPASLDPLKTIGSFLAVDPLRRALVFAAHQGSLLIASYHGSERHVLDFDGVLHDLTFLSPLTHDPDHVTLLLVAICDAQVLMHCVEWSNAAGLASARMQKPQKLDIAAAHLGLLISLPSSSAALLTCRHDIYVLRGRDYGRVAQQPHSIRGLPAKPASTRDTYISWLAWSYTDTDVDKDIILVRSDGHVCCLGWAGDRSEQAPSVSLGILPGPLSAAFAAVGLEDGSHLMTFMGDNGAGGLYQMIFEDHGHLDLVQIGVLPVLTPVTDFSTVSHNLTRGLFVACGRQPHGSIKELRLGLEARTFQDLAIEGLHGCVGLHVLHRPHVADALLLFAFPSMPDMDSLTLVVTLSEGGASTLDHDEIARYGLDVQRLTLATASGGDFACQISTGSINILSHSAGQNSMRLDLSQTYQRIICAGIDPEMSFALIATHDIHPSAPEMMADRTTTAQLRLLRLPRPSFHNGSPNMVLDFGYVPTVICAFRNSSWSLAAVGGSDQTLTIVRMCVSSGLETVFQHSFARSGDLSRVCESIVAVSSDSTLETTKSSDTVLHCGMRDGSLCTLVLGFGLSGQIKVRSSHRLVLASTTIRLIQYQDSSKHGVEVLAATDTTLHSVSIARQSSHVIVDIAPVWVTDPSRPSWRTGNITGLAHIPRLVADSSPDVDGYLAVVSDDICVFAQLFLEHTNVSRSLGLQGTPTRMIYSPQLAQFVVATVQTVKPNETQNVGDTIRGCIEFCPPGTSRSTTSCFQLQAEERIYAMTDWVYRKEGNKIYVFILVGTAYLDADSNAKGRIHIVQPVLRRGKIEGASLATSLRFDAPVCAIAMYDQVSFVAGSGDSLVLYVYSPDDKKWNMTVEETLPSRAVCITVSRVAGSPYAVVAVTTASHSLMAFTSSTDPDQRGLELLFTDTGVHAGIRHVAIQDAANYIDQLLVMTTRHQQIRGFALRRKSQRLEIQCVFHAQLDRSLIGIQQLNTSTLPGQTELRTYGVSPDGTIHGLAVLNAHDWAVLRYVQTLCERSKELSPHRRQRSIYETSNGTHDLLPLGFGGLRRTDGESVGAWEARTNCLASDLSLARWRVENMHVDGDILQRLVRGGEAALMRLVDVEAREQRGVVGAFVSRHRAREEGMVPETMRRVNAVLTMWKSADVCARQIQSS